MPSGRGGRTAGSMEVASSHRTAPSAAPTHTGYALGVHSEIGAGLGEGGVVG